jgi:hypothetical protein
VSIPSGYLEGKYGHCTDISISRLGEDIPRACRCISDNTWSYLGAARSEILGSPDSICENKFIRLRTKLERDRKRRPSHGLCTAKVQALLIGKTLQDIHKSLSPGIPSQKSSVVGENMSMVTTIPRI